MDNSEDRIENDEGDRVVDRQPNLAPVAGTSHITMKLNPSGTAPNSSRTRRRPHRVRMRSEISPNSGSLIASQQRLSADRPAGVVRSQPGDIGQEIQLEEHHNRQRDAGAQVAGAKEQFRCAAEVCLGSLKCLSALKRMGS